MDTIDETFVNNNKQKIDDNLIDDSIQWDKSGFLTPNKPQVSNKQNNNLQNDFI
jgi:hypothetical protein